MHTYICIYIYAYIHIYVDIYIYIYRERERERERERDRQTGEQMKFPDNLAVIELRASLSIYCWPVNVFRSGVSHDKKNHFRGLHKKIVGKHCSRH